MPSQVQKLELELERTLEMIRHFREFTGALNYTALKILVENKPEGSVAKVAVRDTTGHFYRGEIAAINPSGGTLDVLADDGELVAGLLVERIVAVRIQDKM